MMMARTSLFAVFALLGGACALPAAAQFAPGGGFSGQQQPVPAPNFFPDVKAMAEDAAKRYNVPIVVDPGIVVTQKPVPLAKDLTITQTMDGLAKMARGLTWRRVYLAQGTTGQAPTIPPASSLVSTVRALDKVEASGLVLENPATKQATTYVKNWAVTPTFSNDLTASQFSNSAVYVLYSKELPAGAVKERLADLQRESMSLMMGLTPAEMADVANQGVQMLMNLDPATRAQFMAAQMQAGMQMMQSLPPDQLNALIQQSVQIFQQSGIGRKP